MTIEINLPSSWCMAPLSDLGVWSGGGTPSKQNAAFWNGTIPWVSPKDMKRETIADAADHISKEAIDQSATALIASNSVLCVTRSGILAHTFPVAVCLTPVTINQDLKALTPHDGIEASYVAWALRANGRRILNSCSKDGTTVASVETSRLQAFEIPLAPSSEQLRIVNKIDELFSELENGVHSLHLTRQKLAVYRQSVLKNAFQGKLTESWRRQNYTSLESPEKLMAILKRAREATYQDRLSKWKANPKSVEKPRAPKNLSPLSAQLAAHLTPLPNAWAWDRLGWMTCGVEYGTAAKSSESGAVPVLRMGNIQNAKFDWADLVFTSDQNEIERYSLRVGDVLFNRTNSPELVGKTATYQGERPAVFAGYLIRVNQIHEIVDAQYLNLFLNSDIARQYGKSVKTDGVNQSNINGDKLANYPFPYCSLAEQKEVVRLLEEQLSVADRLELEIIDQIQRAQALRQAILDRAFSGCLVESDSASEPACELLQRINSERLPRQVGRMRRKRAA